MCWLRRCNFLLKGGYFRINTDNFTIDLTILFIAIAKCCFLSIFSVQFDWKFENPRWWPLVTSFIWRWLPWKPELDTSCLRVTFLSLYLLGLEESKLFKMSYSVPRAREQNIKAVLRWNGAKEWKTLPT